MAGTPEVESRNSLLDTFVAFASFGLGSSPQPGKATAEMDSRQFIKLCRDARLIDRRLTQTSCDLAFTKVKTMGARKISFKQFRKALELLAAEKNVTKGELSIVFVKRVSYTFASVRRWTCWRLRRALPRMRFTKLVLQQTSIHAVVAAEQWMAQVRCSLFSAATPEPPLTLASCMPRE
jgi:hypothetical protein